MRVFVDTNVPMYAGGKVSSYKVPCAKVLELVAKESMEATTSSEVFQEILYRFWYLKEVDKGLAIFDHFGQILSDVLPVTLEDVKKARVLSEQYSDIPPRDLLHVATMINNQIDFIVSADKDFDGVSEIERVDPLDFENWFHRKQDKDGASLTEWPKE